MCVCVPQSSPILCYPMDCTPPGSSVHGILQARILEWVAISFSTRSSQTRDWTSVFCIGWQILYHLSHQGSPRETFVMLWAEQEHFCRVFYVLFWKSSWQCWLKIIRKTHFPCTRHLLHVYVLRMSYSVLFSSLILSKEPTAAPFTKYTFNGCWQSWINSVQLLSHVRRFMTPCIAARQASLSISNSRSSPKLMCIKSVMPSSHLILCCPLLLCPQSLPPSIRVFSNESTLRMRWPKYWSFSFSISPSNEHPGLVCFRMDWLDLLADYQESSPTPQFKSTNFSALSFLHSPILTSMHNHWKNHSLD